MQKQCCHHCYHLSKYSAVLKQLPEYPNSANGHLIDICLGHHGTLCRVGEDDFGHRYSIHRISV